MIHRKFTNRLMLGLAAAAVALQGAAAHACMPVTPSPEARVSVVDESAVIVWDAKTKTQHFIRRATFETKAKDLGFLVPSPSQPELAEASDAAFHTLTVAIAPRVVEQERKVWQLGSLFFGRRISNTFNSAGNSMTDGFAAGAAAPDVEVLHRQQVGSYDATVLAATNAEALNKWLKQHGYISSPELAEWVEPYVKQGWKITAFKISNKDDEVQISTTTVRMSFKADRPFFPYREPASQREKPKSGAFAPRSLRVFFISNERVTGALDEKATNVPWPGKTEWAGKLPDSARTELLDSLKLKPEQLPTGTTLTAFEDRSTPRPGTVDVFFSRASDQNAVEPPPIIEYRDVPRIIPIEGILLLMFIVYVGWTVFLRGRLERRLA